jgi:hypothetical protein
MPITTTFMVIWPGRYILIFKVYTVLYMENPDLGPGHAANRLFQLLSDVTIKFKYHMLLCFKAARKVCLPNG